MTPGEWLTVAEAAARLQVSERTIKRRIAAGEWAARYEPLPGGGRRRLLHFAAQGPNAEDVRDTGTGDTKATAKDVRDTAPNANALPAGTSDNASASSARDTRDVRDIGGPAPDAQALLQERDAALAARDAALAERDRERDEVQFLRTRMTELNAVMMQQARALDAARERPALEAEQSPAPQSVQAQGLPKVPQRATRKPRPLWMLVLGLRWKD